MTLAAIATLTLAFFVYVLVALLAPLIDDFLDYIADNLDPPYW